jgi:NAD(P)-dependent dehydrogenase (short-subunit alcohol dehydrogenase family)
MAPFPSFTKVWHTSPYPSISLNRSELSLAGKSVIITGGGSGIGASIAQSAALAGASKLAIIGRRTQALSDIARKIEILVGDKTQVFTVSADVANKEQVDVAFSRITAQFGEKPMDILVNNAGFFTGMRPLGTEGVEEWMEKL